MRRLFNFSVLLLLLLAGCDSITSVDESDKSHPLLASETRSSVSSDYTATVLPDGLLGAHFYPLIIDDERRVYASVVDENRPARAARWTFDANGNASGRVLLGDLPEPHHDAEHWISSVNAGGVAVGTAEHPSTGAGSAAWVWVDGNMMILPAPENASRSAAMAVNDAGVVVGQVGFNAEEEGEDYAAVWLPPYDGEPILLPAVEGYTLNSARGITNEGVITGWVRDFSRNLPEAILQWEIDAGGNVVRGPELLESGINLLVADTNEDLDAVGTFGRQAYLYRADADQRIDLQPLGAYEWSWARGVSPRSDDGTVGVAGYSYTETGDNSAATLWRVSAGGVVAGSVDLGLPEPTPIKLRGNRTDYIDFLAAGAYSINNQGWIVGWSSREDGAHYATLWRPNESDGGGETPPSGNGPTASFSYSCSGDTCQFTDTSTAGDSPISGWSWTSSSGAAASSQNASFSFPEAGSYSVTLTVSDAASSSDTASAAVSCSMNRKHGLRCS